MNTIQSVVQTEPKDKKQSSVDKVFTGLSGDLRISATILTFKNRAPVLYVVQRDHPSVSQLISMQIDAEAQTAYQIALDESGSIIPRKDMVQIQQVIGLPFESGSGSVDYEYQIEMDHTGSTIYVAQINTSNQPLIFKREGNRFVQRQFIRKTKDQLVSTISRLAIITSPFTRYLIAVNPDQLTIYQEGLCNAVSYPQNETVGIQVKGDAFWTLSWTKSKDLLLTKWGFQGNLKYKTESIIKIPGLSIKNNKPSVSLAVRQDVVYIGIDNTLYAYKNDETRELATLSGTIKQLWEYKGRLVSCQQLKTKKKVQVHLFNEAGEVKSVTIGNGLTNVRSVQVVNGVVVIAGFRKSEEKLFHHFIQLPQELPKGKPKPATLGSQTLILASTPIAEEPTSQEQPTDGSGSGIGDTTEQPSTSKKPVNQLATKKAFKAFLNKISGPFFCKKEDIEKVRDAAFRQLTEDFNQWLEQSCSDPVKAVIIPNGEEEPSFILVEFPSLVPWYK